MGVISTNKPPLLTSGDDFFPIDYLIESPITTDDEEEHDNQQQRLDESLSRRRRRTDNRRYPYFHQNLLGAPVGKKNVGIRKQRRLDNSRLVFALVDRDEICDDLSDTLPDTVSAFTQLFLEAEKMKAWNTFIHKTEEEQSAILRGQRRGRKTSTARGKKVDKQQKQETAEGAGDEVASMSKDEKRHIHPAHSGSLCFRRIEGRLKTLLTQKHVPWEKLDQFERDLTEFFTTSPDGVFVTILESGYDRLLLHAVAQYLRLKSQSIGPLDHRETQIESYSDRDFEPPLQTLTSFLHQHYGKPRLTSNSGCSHDKDAPVNTVDQFS